jgi:hypothetical protein
MYKGMGKKPIMLATMINGVGVEQIFVQDRLIVEANDREGNNN